MHRLVEQRGQLLSLGCGEGNRHHLVAGEALCDELHSNELLCSLAASMCTFSATPTGPCFSPLTSPTVRSMRAPNIAALKPPWRIIRYTKNPTTAAKTVKNKTSRPESITVSPLSHMTTNSRRSCGTESCAYNPATLPKVVPASVLGSGVLLRDSPHVPHCTRATSNECLHARWKLLLAEPRHKEAARSHRSPRWHVGWRSPAAARGAPSRRAEPDRGRREHGEDCLRPERQLRGASSAAVRRTGL